MSVDGLMQEEDIQTKIFKLEDRVASLEQMLNSTVGDAKQVLTDVRAILSELENPMNYLKSLGIDEVMLSMAEQITEAKLKEFMDRKISALIKTMVEGRIKDAISSKVKEVLDDELKKALGETVQDVKKLLELLNGEELIKALEERIPQVVNPDKIKEDILNELSKEIDSKISDLKSSLETIKLSGRSKEDQSTSGAENNIAYRNSKMSQPLESKSLRLYEVVLSRFLGSYCLLSVLGRKRLGKILSQFIDLGLIDSNIIVTILRLSSNLKLENAHDIFDDVECYVISDLILNLINNGPDPLKVYAIYLLVRKCNHLINVIMKLKSKPQS